MKNLFVLKCEPKKGLGDIFDVIVTFDKNEAIKAFEYDALTLNGKAAYNYFLWTYRYIQIWRRGRDSKKSVVRNA